MNLNLERKLENHSAQFEVQAVNWVTTMMGNGLANIIAAAIVALAIVWTGGFGDGRDNTGSAPMDKDEFTEWYARAVGDIRNDIVVNCGCCGEGAGQRRAGLDSFQ